MGSINKGNIHKAPNAAPIQNNYDQGKSTGASIIKKQKTRPNPMKGGGINRKLESMKQN